MKNILITGATGFVGRALCEQLKKSSHRLKAIVRSGVKLDDDISVINCDLDKVTDYEAILSNVDVVIHLAGRAHILKETESDAYEAFAAINIRATERLVNAAAQFGVERFIYMSTTKVCGESTIDQPFNEDSPLNPSDDYAKTKAIAESIIQEVCANSTMDYVIIRPPLVYGPNVKANFKRLISISRSRWPIPFGAIHNRRSMIYIENLVDIVSLCINHPMAANQVFFVSDDQDLSTSYLIHTLIKYQQRKAYLLPVPVTVLKVLFNCLRPGLFTKLCENLQVDITKVKTTLDWKAPYSAEQGLRETVNAS